MNNQMNRILKLQATFVCGTLLLASCAQQQSTAPTNESKSSNQTGEKGTAERSTSHLAKYPASNPDDYQAGDDWKLIWADEFNEDALNLNNWTRQIMPDPFNDEWQQYFDRKENAYVADGYLVLRAIHNSDVHGDNQYTSARLHTGGKQTWQYGRIAARIQLPFGQGIWPAFWMLGADVSEIGGSTPWPKCGEIDILELYGTRDDAVVEACLHYDDDGHRMSGAVPYRLNKGIFAEQFHVFEIEWNEQEIIWYVDGQPYSTVSITDETMEEFHGPFYILLNIAVGGTAAGRPDDSTPFPALMYVDWVRVYQK